MNLFEQARKERMESDAPLAARMRPRVLDDFVGQEAIVGPGRLLRRAIQADQLSSLIFYGPPGTGKTTLAQVIANTTAAHFIALNAVLAGVKDIRAAIDQAQERLALHNQRTILFVDEVHRFNKAQQDALLPWVENGTVIFVGATTENPYFEVNKALVSRSRIFQLKPLNEDHLRQIARHALADPERGYGKRNATIDEDALDHLVSVSNGDARALLNALELAAETTPVSTSSTKATDSPPEIRITMEIAEESIQRRAVLYDKEGDYHFDTISAYIKSLRGSDPDAALYWLAKMIYAGEDPRFIFRRMIIFAGEDVGMADPQAIQVVTACAAAFDRIGLPEGHFPLAHATIYLATAEKSNSAMAFFDALETIRNEPESDVPNHLRDANRDKEGFGHGEGYLYPHAYREHWVAQQYLPDSMQGKVFYRPSERGDEARVQRQVTQRREAQLAAMMDETGAPPEILTFSPQDSARERWLQRTISNAGAELARLRDRLLSTAPLPRHGVLLDVNAASGLLTWEAVRRLPEGGVYALAYTADEAQALRDQAASLSPVDRPQVLEGLLASLPHLLADEPSLRFDGIVGRNALLRSSDRAGDLARLAGLLSADGWLALAERIPRHTQRIYALIDCAGLGDDLAQRFRAAEEAIYRDTRDELVNWDEEDLRTALGKIENRAWDVQLLAGGMDMQVTPALLARWFGPATGERPSYAQRLAEKLTKEEVDTIEALVRAQLLHQQIRWESRTALILSSPLMALPDSGAAQK
ncbi:MAG: AAA family ATPase [Caldilineaceae bacterium]|nr:AAA family ATPase [Caldilineaceae bacterium]